MAHRWRPARYFLVIVRGGLLRDQPTDVVVGQLSPMAVVTLVAARRLFHARLV